MSGASAPARSPLAKEDPAALRSLALIGAGVIALTVAAPFAFKAGGDNAFIAVAIPAALLALAATSVAERTSARRTLWLIAGVAIALRIVAISFPPLLSTGLRPGLSLRCAQGVSNGSVGRDNDGCDRHRLQGS